MTDWNKPLPFLIVFTPRGGSTFLAHCLDSHPQVGCLRGEPLREGFIWRKVFRNATPEQLLAVAFNRPGYHAAGCRVTRRCFKEIEARWLQRRKVRIMFLYRENVLRIILSSIINTRRGDGKHNALSEQYHTYERVPMVRINLDVKHFLSECERYTESVADIIRRVSALKLPTLYLTYAEIVGGEGSEAEHIPSEVGDKICDFLRVDRLKLYAQLKRTNPEPIRDIVTNWAELRKAVRKSKFKQWLPEAMHDSS